MFDFFRSKKKQKKMIKAYVGPHYRLTDTLDRYQQDQGSPEHKGEPEILTLSKRLQLLDICRNAVRNNPSIAAILNNFQNAVVGNDFKLIYTGEENDEIRKLKTLFKRWCREVDFFDRTTSFRDFLSILLKTILISGDCTIVFDDNLVKDSGRILLFESDEQGDLPQDVLEQIYGKGSRQIDGRVYNRYGEHCGVILSKSQRGQEVYDVSKSYCLKSDPDKSYFESIYFQPRISWRVCQGRGISPLIPAIGAAENLEDVINSEIATTKKSSRLLAQIYDTRETSEEVLPSAYSEDEIQAMTPEQIEELVKAQSQDQQVVGFETVRSCAAQVIQLPDGKRMDLLDPNHPNLNTIDFITKLQARICATLGVSQMYGTYDCSGAGSTDVQMQLSWQTFSRYQKMLEQVADWIFHKFVQWEVRRGEIDGSKLPDDLEFNVQWSHPTKESLDEVKNQQAIKAKLENMTGSYREILGPDWREKLEQMKDEINWLKANQLPVPQYKMLSGGESTGADQLAEDVK